VVLDDVLAPDPRVGAVAGGLRERGVKRGDYVAWQRRNDDAGVLLYRACWRLGATAVPLHHQAGPADVDRMVGSLDGDVLVVEDVPDGRPVVAVDASPDDIAVVLFTSGSSGAPKGVRHTHAALAYKAQLMVGVHGLTRTDVVLMPAPLAHISGLLNAVLVAGAAPFRAVLMAKWDPDEALTIIEHQRVTFMVGPPTFFIDLMGASHFVPEHVASLRLISSGGAGVTPAFCQEATERLGARVKRAYGSTEAPTVTTSAADDPPERGWSSDGRLVGQAELQVGPASELWVRGPELFAGYVDAAQTALAMTDDGWFKTGDTAVVDDDGWVTITGRLGHVIIRGGENISVTEVEQVLEAHPAVRHAVVVAYPDDRLGERVAAVVVADAAFNVEACATWFAERGVARYKTPERVLVIAALPTLSSGKPDRRAIAALIS
jgi:acyl-CoA synthetase (AMP-forming)/AMP-acid ligase II